MELLRQFVHRNSDEAFAALVTRHVNMVYSAALRKTGNAHAAEEIAQAVFIILAKKAERLRDATVLSGWLYQTARLTSASFLRTEIRRARREQEAYMQTLSNATGSDVWPEIEPLLEDAMGTLGEKERNALALRFFEGKSFHEIGAAVGASENAAKKRVSHALEKLRGYFLKRGVASTTAIIAGAISANSVQAAPAVLTKSITAVAMMKGVAASGPTLTLIEGALKLMAWTKAKTAILVAVIVAGTATTTVIIRHQSKPPGGHPAGQPVIWDKASFAFAGYATPQATMKTMLWAMGNGDTDMFLAGCTPEAKANKQKHWREKPKASLVEEGRQRMEKITGIKILDETVLAEDRVLMTVHFEGENNTEELPFKKIGSEWKLAE